MELTQEQLAGIKAISEEVLTALEKVSLAAQAALTPSSSGAPVLAVSANPMVGPDLARESLGRIRQEARRHVERVVREPFVSRVKLRWNDGNSQTFYVTRGSAAGIGGGYKLVSQATPAGQLATLEPGDEGEMGGREYCIVECVHLRPERTEAWDGLDDEFLLDSTRAAVESLRALVGAPAAAEDVLEAIFAGDVGRDVVRETGRRRVIERMALRDQPVLDRHQDAVARIRLDGRVLLLGPPGSGKTTTLIRRLAFKRHPEGLTEEERETLDRTSLQTEFDRASGWVMFAPTELLQRYLRDAFSREQVPAEARNLRTWDRERRDLARNALGILRTQHDGPGFSLQEDLKILKDESSTALAALHDAFLPFSTKASMERIRGALGAIMSAQDEGVAAAARDVSKKIGFKSEVTVREVGQLLDHAALLAPEVTRLTQATKRDINGMAAKLIGRHDSPLMRDLVVALPKLRGGVDDDDEDDDDDDESDLRTRNPDAEAASHLLRGLRSRARQVATGRGKRPSARVARLLEVLGERAPGEEELRAVGTQLVLIRELRVVQRAPRRLVRDMPTSYARFRRAHSDVWFASDAGEARRSRRITPHEVDVLILAMLGTARRLLALDSRRYSGPLPDWLESIRQRYVPQIYVDEATDFSSVQLACTLELAHPRLRSWFACGDFRQRITASGVQRVDELKWIAKAVGLADEIEDCEVAVGYRQSSRLRALAAALEALQEAGQRPIPASDSVDEDDIWPLLCEQKAGSELATWIADRIAEIGQTVRVMPSVAVFVDGEDRIDEIADALRAALQEQNLPVVACRDGRDIGDRQEIRVFDVQHIKGLEFEAVFLVGIDVLASRLPELFSRFLYVGLTRAATYLAVTAETHLPSVLDPVRGHFSTENWDP